MDWFTSDTHFNHANVIVYCSRPFCDVEEMNRAMIERWNARVGKDDTTYHLGDFALSNKARIAEFRRALNGRIVLILGNHDRSRKAMLECGFDEAHEEGVYWSADHGEFLLHHEPLYVKGESESILDLPERFAGHLCGHIHEKWAARVVQPYNRPVINVGVDQNNFQPITFEEALARPQRPSVSAGKLLKCRACPRTIAKAESFENGCPKCGARETEPFSYEET